MSLPHRFPFQLVDRNGSTVRLRLTGGGYWLRGGRTFGLPLLVEAAAQAAALLTAPEGRPQEGLLLAGLSDCTLLRPVSAGESLEFEVSLQARMGAVVRVGAIVRATGEPVARLTLTLTRSVG